MRILIYSVVVVVLLLAWAVISMHRHPIRRTVKAWSRLSDLVPGYVASLTIGSRVWNNDEIRSNIRKTFIKGLQLYHFEWEKGAIGTWGDSIEGSVEYKSGKRFRFFIRFNRTEPQVAFFVKSLPHPFAFGTKELSLLLRESGIAENVE
jgi:hypothetical protein